MELEIKKWGNSLGLRIPHKLALSYGLEENSVVEILETESGMIIRKKNIPISLQSLLATIPTNFTYPEDVQDFVNSAATGQEML